MQGRIGDELASTFRRRHPDPEMAVLAASNRGRRPRFSKDVAIMDLIGIAVRRRLFSRDFRENMA